MKDLSRFICEITVDLRLIDPWMIVTLQLIYGIHGWPPFIHDYKDIAATYHCQNEYHRSVSRLCYRHFATLKPLEITVTKLSRRKIHSNSSKE